MKVTAQKTTDVFQGRREALLRWVGIGGIVALLVGGGLLNGHTGVLDAAWQVLMGGGAGWVYAMTYGPLTGRLRSKKGKAKAPSKKHLWENGGEWFFEGKGLIEIPLGTVVISACLVPVIVECITPVADFGNSALLAIWATSMGGCVGGGIQLWRSGSDPKSGLSGALQREASGREEVTLRPPPKKEHGGTTTRSGEKGHSGKRVASRWTGTTGRR